MLSDAAFVWQRESSTTVVIEPSCKISTLIGVEYFQMKIQLDNTISVILIDYSHQHHQESILIEH